MKQKPVFFINAILIFSLLFSGIKTVQVSAHEGGYHPEIKPEEFSTTINNKYFSLESGQKMIFEEPSEDGLEMVEIYIPGDTRMIMGVKTLVYRDTVKIDGELVEDTTDYLAQHQNGDVWYFGEEVNNYEDGKLVDHEGSWIAGENNAHPGIWVKQNPKVGESYLQEYLKGEAEDTSDVLSITETVTTKNGTYTNCLQTYDWTPLDAKSKEHKYYCPEVKMMVVSKHVGETNQAELISITKAATNKPTVQNTKPMPTVVQMAKTGLENPEQTVTPLIKVMVGLGGVMLVGGMMYFIFRK